MDYLILTIDDCPYCDKAKAHLKERGIPFKEVNLMDSPELCLVGAMLGQKTAPLILKRVGGYTDLVESLP